MSAPSPNELMQEGIQQVRDNETDRAYNTFKQVVARDPNSEFGWIWVSVTSQDRAEKRAALERALQINPNSQHARDALRSLDAETPKASPPPPPFYTPARIGEAEINTAPQFGPPEGDSLRATLGSKPPRGRVKKEKTPKAVVVKEPTMVSRKQRPRPALFLFPILLALAIIAVFVWYFLFRNPNQTQQAGPAPADTTVATTAADVTTVGDTTTPATTAAVATTEAALTVAPANSVAPVATTAPATTTPTDTTPAATTAPATTATAVTVTLPAGASQTAQIAKVLETARQSQAQGDYATAIASYQAALQADSRNVPANLGLGNVYLTAPDKALPTNVKRYDEAVKAFQVVTEQAPNWPGGYALLGEALADQGQLKPAITAYSKSLELDPNGPERWAALASLYDKDNQPAQARFARERAGILKPATPTPVPTTAPPTTQPPAPVVPAPPKTQPPAPTPVATPRPPVITPKPSPKK